MGCANRMGIFGTKIYLGHGKDLGIPLLVSLFYGKDLGILLLSMLTPVRAESLKKSRIFIPWSSMEQWERWDSIPGMQGRDNPMEVTTEGDI